MSALTRRLVQRARNLAIGLAATASAHAGGDLVCTDLTGDNLVGLDDLSICLASYGADDGCDFDQDGDSDLEDLARLIAQFGTTCQPDLVVTAVETEPAPGTVNLCPPFTTTFTVANVGNEVASGPVDVSLTLAGKLLAEQNLELGVLLPGASLSGEFTDLAAPPSTPAGSQPLAVEVDVLNQVPERDEGNNQLPVLVDVVAPAFDIAVVAVTHPPSVDSNADATVMVTLVNYGAVDAIDVPVTVCIGGACEPPVAVTVPACGETTITIQATAPAFNGSCGQGTAMSLNVCADIDDADAFNDCFTSSISVIGLYWDLRICCIDPEFPNDYISTNGPPVRWTYRVRNVGNTASPSRCLRSAICTADNDPQCWGAGCTPANFQTIPSLAPGEITPDISSGWFNPFGLFWGTQYIKTSLDRCNGCTDACSTGNYSSREIDVGP